MKKTVLIVFVALIGIGLGTLAYTWPMVKGAWTAWRPAPALVVSEQILQSDAQNPANSSSTRGSLPALSTVPFTVPEGFAITLFADKLPGARVLAEDELGNIWVSQTKEGRVVRLDVKQGVVTDRETVLENLKSPHGLAFDPRQPNMLYVATEQALYRYAVYTADAQLEKVLDFPKGGRHTTRTLLFGADGKLYVSLGSSCDVCFEKDQRLGTVQVVDVHAKAPQLAAYAIGLRNAVFMALHPESKAIWVTEMGRDFLGNTDPPDEINILKPGGNYGWPVCYGDNIHDTAFDKRSINPCATPLMTPSQIDLPAHVAPLGLAFIPKEAGWPVGWEDQLLVSFHGSWNSTKPVGYKVVRLKIDAEGRSYGSEDLIGGFLTDRETRGRPVDLLFDTRGALLVSDDKAGAIYRVTPLK